MSKEIIEKLLLKDHKTVEQIYDAIYPQIRRYVLKNSGNEVDAEDLFQDALLILYKNALKPDFELHVQLNSYIFSVVRNQWLKKLRKRRRFKVMEEPKEVSLEERTYDDQESAILREKLYRRKLNTLDTKCRELLMLFYRKMSMADIAEQMGFQSVGYARKRKYKCKEKLLESIRKDPLYKELSAHD